jgi:hypothetical protein
MLQVINGKIDGFVGETKIYIGRSNQTYQLRSSPLQNPFRIGRDGNREQVINKYQKWLHKQVKIGLAGHSNSAFNKLVQIAKLVKMGKSVQLTCWCKPKLCHGDVIKRYIDWLNKEDKKATL